MHVHVLPRRLGDFVPNDKVRGPRSRPICRCCGLCSAFRTAYVTASPRSRTETKTHVSQIKVYEELEAVHLKQHFDLDAERRPRTSDEMAAEARKLRALFPARQWQRREAQKKEEER